jgi:hypothetical protein
MSNLIRGPFIDASYQVSVNLARQFQRRRFFRNQPIRNKHYLWWPCLLMDWDEMGILYRGPSIDASYQVSVHLVSGFRGEDFLDIDQSETWYEVSMEGPLLRVLILSRSVNKHGRRRQFLSLIVDF